MKSTLFVVLISLAITCSLGVQLKQSSCPSPSKDWQPISFGQWKVVARTDETTPRTVYNTIEIAHLYAGKGAVISRGASRDIWTTSNWDEVIEYAEVDFGKSYYDFLDDDEEPKTFTVTNSAGLTTQYSMPYFAQPHYAEAVIFSCTQIDEETIDAKAWFVSKIGVSTISDEVKELVKSLTGKDLTTVCQGDFC